MSAARAARERLDRDVAVKRLPAARAVGLDPRFTAILARSRAEFAVLLKDLDAAKARGELPTYLQHLLADLRQKLGM